MKRLLMKLIPKKDFLDEWLSLNQQIGLGLVVGGIVSLVGWYLFRSSVPLNLSVPLILACLAGIITGYILTVLGTFLERKREEEQ